MIIRLATTSALGGKIASRSSKRLPSFIFLQVIILETSSSTIVVLVQDLEGGVVAIV